VLTQAIIAGGLERCGTAAEPVLGHGCMQMTLIAYSKHCSKRAHTDTAACRGTVVTVLTAGPYSGIPKPTRISLSKPLLYFSALVMRIWRAYAGSLIITNVLGPKDNLNICKQELVKKQVRQAMPASKLLLVHMLHHDVN
jgi:hypothetical protein